MGDIVNLYCMDEVSFLLRVFVFVVCLRCLESSLRVVARTAAHTYGVVVVDRLSMLGVIVCRRSLWSSFRGHEHVCMCVSRACERRSLSRDMGSSSRWNTWTPFFRENRLVSSVVVDGVESSSVSLGNTRIGRP